MLRVVAVFTLIGLASAASAQTSFVAESDIIYPGAGYDTLRGTVRNLCVNIDPTAPLKTAGGRVQYSLQNIESQSELDGSLGVSLAAKYSAVSGSAKYSRSVYMNRFSSYFIISIKNISRVEGVLGAKLEPVTLKPEWYAELGKSVNLFRERCGDGFVASRELGGIYTAVIEVKTATDREQSDVRAKISNSAGVFSGSAELNSHMQAAVSGKEIKIRLAREGGTGDLVTTPGSLQEKIASFPTELDAKM